MQEEEAEEEEAEEEEEQEEAAEAVVVVVMVVDYQWHHHQELLQEQRIRQSVSSPNENTSLVHQENRFHLHMRDVAMKPRATGTAFCRLAAAVPRFSVNSSWVGLSPSTMSVMTLRAMNGTPQP